MTNNWPFSGRFLFPLVWAIHLTKMYLHLEPSLSSQNGGDPVARGDAAKVVGLERRQAALAWCFEGAQISQA